MATQKSLSVAKVQALALLAAIVGTPLFAKIADLATNSQLSCSTIGDIGGCNNYDIFYYFFGFYFSFLFIVSAANFGFLKWNRFDYYVVMLLFLALSLLEFEILKLALAFTLAGVILGIIIRKIRSMRQARAA